MNDLALSLRHKGIKWLDQVPSFNLFDTQLTELRTRVDEVRQQLSQFVFVRSHVPLPSWAAAVAVFFAWSIAHAFGSAETTTQPALLGISAAILGGLITASRYRTA